jgi:hypothetical protein
MLAVRIDDPVLAVRFAVVVAVTTLVPNVNVALVAPGATVTVAGTIAFVLPDTKAIIKPPAGAGPVIETEPVADIPPTTVVGLTVKLASAGGNTVRFV